MGLFTQTNLLVELQRQRRQHEQCAELEEQHRRFVEAHLAAQTRLLRTIATGFGYRP